LKIEGNIIELDFAVILQMELVIILPTKRLGFGRVKCNFRVDLLSFGEISSESSDLNFQYCRIFQDIFSTRQNFNQKDSELVFLSSTHFANYTYVKGYQDTRSLTTGVLNLVRA